MLTLSDVQRSPFDELLSTVAAEVTRFQSGVIPQCERCRVQMAPFSVDGQLKGVKCPQCKQGATATFTPEYSRVIASVRDTMHQQQVLPCQP
jgi:tRNA(Ile2) C34 agmatinyltransferase TiaS